MAGKHRKRPGLPVRIPEQRVPRAVRVVDARTRVEHVVLTMFWSHIGCAYPPSAEP